jgi:hypothetical protein
LKQAGNNFGVGKEKPLPNLVNPISNIDTTKKLAEIAGVGKETYRMGAKVLSSGNEEVKQRVLSGETSISAGYKELNQKKQENENKKGESSNIIPFDNNSQISDEVKQICADLKTEKTNL